MRDIMTKEVSDAILKTADEIKLARVYEASTQKPYSVQIVTLKLDAATLPTNPYKIGFKFKSFFVVGATDSSVSVNLKVNSRDDLQSSFPIKINDSCDFDNMVAEAYIDWSAQATKTITIVFFTDAAFRSGSQLSISSGGVSIFDGSTISGPFRIAVPAVTATIIIAQNTSRKVATLQNKTGALLYIGGPFVGAVGSANEGIAFPDQSIIKWNNTGALYGWSVAGGNVSYIEEA